MIKICTHCQKQAPTKRYEQKMGWFRGDDEVHNLCSDCYLKKEKLYPEYRKKKHYAVYPRKSVNMILKLRERGYEVKQLSDYQFRINGKIDIYPVNGLYHNL